MKRDKKTVSYNMSRIKGKDTSIEKTLRKALYQEGYRYRKNVSTLPGHPDIVLSKYRICIFCDGDFFHGYDLGKTEKQLKSNKDFWYKKIMANQKRDCEEDKELVALGYRVFRFWEHEIRNSLPAVLHEIDMAIKEEEEKSDFSFSKQVSK